MYGRNGADKLGQVMLWVYLGIMVLQLIFGSLEWTALAVVCQLLM